MGLTAAIRKSPQTANGFTDQAIPEIERWLMIPVVTFSIHNPDESTGITRCRVQMNLGRRRYKCFPTAMF
jgi:hypothetical protein